jgi:hypothetical protein
LKKYFIFRKLWFVPLDRADGPTAWRQPVTGLLDPARSESWRKFLFVYSYDDRNAGGMPGQVGGRQAQAPKPEQMPEVDAGKSDSEGGAGCLEPDLGWFI